MESALSWEIMAYAMVFIYSFAGFLYAAKLLVDASKNYLLFALFSCLNTYGVYFIAQHSEYYYMLFGSMILGLTIEFFVMSKTSIRQTFFAAVMFAFHITSVHLVVLMAFSVHLKRAPLLLLYDLYYSDIILFVTMAISFLVLFSIYKFINMRYVKRVTLTTPYSELLSVSIAFVVLYYGFDSYCLVTENFFPEQAPQIFAIVFASLAIVYYMIAYTMNFINLSMYKRQSDAAQASYDEVLDKTKETSNKLVTDHLTKLYNKKFIYNEIDGVINTSGVNFGLLFIDVNALKYMNDTFGHEQGDLYLVEVADAIKNSVRDTDLSARISGDEFLVLLPIIEDEKSIERVITRLKEQIAKKKPIEGIPLSVSLGSLFVREEDKKLGIEGLLDRVDARMRVDKEDYYSNMKTQARRGV